MHPRRNNQILLYLETRTIRPFLDNIIRHMHSAA